MRILITGGAGFVGSSLARAFSRQDGVTKVVAFDNLRRRGSELNVASLKRDGIEFLHGDIRLRSDLEDLPGTFDLIVEASAEPSVHAGINGSPAYVLETNLAGTLRCLEFARTRAGCLVFLSTSRVYSIAPLKAIRYTENETRFVLQDRQDAPGVTVAGIAEEFPTHLPRSYYGASKLASEILIQEYAETAKLRAVINRCGVIAGPGQFGKADQGVFTLWLAHHYFRKPLRYTGFGGLGKQVRDLLHPEDLFELIQRELEMPAVLQGAIFNVGGGCAGSTSLRELTAVCEQLTGNHVPIDSDPATASVDVPLFICDTQKAETSTGWKPKRGVLEIMRDTLDWLRTHESQLREVLG
jgi:CDP-paratose 2-epimerase